MPRETLNQGSLHSRITNHPSGKKANEQKRPAMTRRESSRRCEVSMQPVHKQRRIGTNNVAALLLVSSALVECTYACNITVVNQLNTTLTVLSYSGWDAACDALPEQCTVGPNNASTSIDFPVWSCASYPNQRQPDWTHWMHSFHTLLSFSRVLNLQPRR